MADTLRLTVTQTFEELTKLHQEFSQNKPGYTLKAKKVRMLMLICEDVTKGKAKLAAELGISTKTVRIWRQKYIEGGIDLLLYNNKGKKGKITPEIFAELQLLIPTIKSPARRIYVVQEWLKERHGISYSDQNLQRFLYRRFGAYL